MHYLIISYSHKNSDITVRERLAFLNDEQKIETIKKILSIESVNEAIVLSTCNRVEFIISTSNSYEALRSIFKILSLHSGICVKELEGRADVYENEGAVHHIFAVASSLDSLVVGETQIAGQLKDAFNFSYEKGFCSHKLSRLMHYAFKCAAEVRNTTEISKNPVSIASVAVSQAKEIMGGNLNDLTSLVIGAGEISEIVTKHLIANGCNVIIFNRSINRAKDIAKKVAKRVEVKEFHTLSKYINRYRLLFSATGASYPIITDEMVQNSQFERYWFDLAVPRDIEIKNNSKIHIYAVDDLQEIVNTNLLQRREQVSKAYEIVGHYTIDFFKWLQTLMVEPLIKDIRERAKQSAIKEVERAVKKGFIPPKTRKNVEKLVHNAFNSFLHIPTKQLREVSKQPNADTIIEAMEYIFKIDSEITMKDNAR